MNENDETIVGLNGTIDFPRLLIKTQQGKKEEVTLDKELFSIGRADDCDIAVKEQSVSRKHASIRKTSGRYTLEDHSVNGTYINGLKVKEKFLEHGDVIEIGSITIEYVYPERKIPSSMDDQTVLLGDDKTVALTPEQTIVHLDVPPQSPPVKKSVSHRRETQRPIPPKPQKMFEEAGFLEERQRKFPTLSPRHLSYVGSVFLIVLFVCLGIYLWMLAPTKEKELYQEGISLYENKSYEKAIDAFANLLRNYPISKYTNSSKRLLGLSYINKSRRFAHVGDYFHAKEVITDFMSSFPYNPEIPSAKEKLNLYRLQFAKQLENEGRYPLALAEYHAIAKDSQYFREARRRIGEFQSVQKEQSDGIKALLEEGDRYFTEEQYVVPENYNACEIYKRVLVLDPNNEFALRRIQQIKEHYLQKSQDNLIKGDYKEALSNLKPCYTIDPHDEVVRKRIERLEELLSANR